MSKLDRFLMSESLLSECPNLSAITLDRFLSDHRPILLRESYSMIMDYSFRFFHYWLEMEGFENFVNEVWREAPVDNSNVMINMMNKLKYLKKKIRVWNGMRQNIVNDGAIVICSDEANSDGPFNTNEVLQRLVMDLRVFKAIMAEDGKNGSGFQWLVYTSHLAKHSPGDTYLWVDLWHGDMVLKQRYPRGLCLEGKKTVDEASNYPHENLTLYFSRRALEASGNRSFDDLTLTVIDEKTKQGAVVDPVEPEKVISVAKEHGVELKLVLTTHHHWDHAGGNEKIKELVPGIKVYGGSIDNVKGCTNKLENGDKLSLGDGISILSLHTPCHTKGHISYYLTGDEGEDPAVFTGDTLFVAGCGKFFEGTAEQMYESLCVTLASLPKPTQVYCGHE
ncbi:metallo-hydrolase/oxidoreductase superfamily protein, partial [Tanacetum coccineum]